MKNALNIGLKLAVSLGLITYLAYGMDWVRLGQIFAATSAGLFALAVLFFSLSNGLGAVQWHLLLRAQKIPIPFRQSLVFYLVGVFFNNVLLGNIGGDALRIYDIKRLTGQSSGICSAAIIVDMDGNFRQ